MNVAAISSASSGATTSRRFAESLRLPGVALALLLPAAGALGAESRLEITPYGGYRFGGTFEDETASRSIELDDRGSVGLIVDLRESANTQWEVLYSRQDTAADTAGLPGLDPATDVDVHYLQLGGTYQGDGERARPYLALTLGGTHFEPRTAGLDGDTFWSFSVGAGLQLLPAERLGVRLEARAFGTLVESDSSLFCTSGPEGGTCAIAVDGRMLWQLEVFAGLAFRF